MPATYTIKWDEVGKRFYETGVSHGVLYPVLDTIPQGTTNPYGDGVAWNGLTAVNQTGSGGEPSPLYADDIKYLNLISTEEAALSIEAYTYPDAFMECDGSRQLVENSGVYIGQQPRKQFGFSYRTIIGNDVRANDYGYKIHLVYGCYATPSDRNYATVNDSPEAITFSWEISTTPVEVTGFKPTATLVIDSTKTNPQKLALIETKLYGNGTNPGALPLPDEVVTLLSGN